ncbi:hypothetical protein PR048_012136 [Dryococelus australis]|uniref:Uncharacterized protein n=1 Tax=Dryococelus australis TaxID=614101 RepID=A0ABQ9HNI1_9NEOP|nr:hypothetical protein PR048_012136 [Dryococelus australis]
MNNDGDPYMRDTEMRAWCTSGAAVVCLRSGTLWAFAERPHHALRQLELAVGHLRVLALMLALMTEELAAGMQHIVAASTDAVYVVADAREAAALEGTPFVLHELLEPIPAQLLILDVLPQQPEHFDINAEARNTREYRSETAACSVNSSLTRQQNGVTAAGNMSGSPVCQSAPRISLTIWQPSYTTHAGARGGIVVRLLASHLGKPGSIPYGVAPRLSHMGIVSDDAAGGRVFLGDLSFPPSFHPGQFHTHLDLPSSAVKSPLLRRIKPIIGLTLLKSRPNLSTQLQYWRLQAADCSLWTVPEKKKVFRREESRLLTHVGLVLEGELAVVAAAVEVRGALAEEGAVRGAALLRRAEPLEALLDDGRVLAVVVGVHLHIRRADVHLVAAFLRQAHMTFHSPLPFMPRRHLQIHG